MNNTIMIPLDQKQRHAWIKYQLELRGSSLSDIARQLGIQRQNVHLALKKSYPKIERAIADVLGLTPETLWPERYLIRRRSKPSLHDSKNITSAIEHNGVTKEPAHA